MKKILLAIISLFLLVSCGSSEPLDVINPDADYIYFYWKTCPHCINVKKHFDANDIMNKYKIEKREVWTSKLNSEFFTKIVENLWLPSEEVGVPFLYKKSDKSYLIWDAKIIELFDGNVELLK